MWSHKIEPCSRLADIEADLEKLRQEEEALDEKLSERKKQFHLLVHTIHQVIFLETLLVINDLFSRRLYYLKNKRFVRMELEWFFDGKLLYYLHRTIYCSSSMENLKLTNR